MNIKKVMFIFLAAMMLAACGNSLESNADEDNEGQQQSNKNADENNEQNDNSSSSFINTKHLLADSAKAMHALTSMLIKGEIVTDSKHGYVENATTREIEIEISLQDPVMMHQFQNIESATNWPMNLEIYTTPELHYVRDINEDTWQTTPADQASHQYFTIMSATKINGYAEYSEEFQLTEENDHYLLSFAGSGDTFKSVVYHDDPSEMKDTILKDHFNEMEISGSLEMTIDKETLYVTGYTVKYEATVMTGELEEYHINEKATYKVCNFNEYDDMVIPKEVMENASGQNDDEQMSIPDDQEQMNTVQLLKKSAEEIGKLTSMKGVGEIVSDQTNRYQDSTITWDVELDINLVGEVIMHEFLTVEDGRTIP